MTTRLWLGTMLLAAVLSGVAAHVRATHQEALRQARDEATMASYRTTVEQLRSRLAAAQQAYRRDTVQLTRWLVNWDSVRALAKAQSRVDSVPVPVPFEVVRTVVETADSTIAACRSVIQSCETIRGVLEARVEADSATLQALSRSLARAKVRSRFGCVVGPTASLRGIDYAGVSCGVRVF